MPEVKQPQKPHEFAVSSLPPILSGGCGVRLLLRALVCQQGSSVSEDAITAADLARLYGLSMVRAHAWLRELPHVKVGRSRYTRKEWLAGWEAAHLKNPPRVQNFDPLEAAVADRAAWAVGELVRQGKLAVLPKFAGSNEREITDRPAQAGIGSLSKTCMEPAIS